jgi:hypothetical protein
MRPQEHEGGKAEQRPEPGDVVPAHALEEAGNGCTIHVFP